MSDAESMRFKAHMNKLAKEYGLRPQTVVQSYMFERFLERLSKSAFRECFVIKGGVLISSMVGLRARATMDMDTTAVGLPMSQRSIRHAIAKIAALETDDGVEFSVVGVSRIRIEVEGYEGIRVKLLARFHGLRVPFSIDVTKGDVITPKPELYSFASSFGEGRASVLAYTVETILAEKCEAILKRNVVGTRPRDYYDVYLLTRIKKIRPRVFRTALLATFEKCGTSGSLENAGVLLDAIAQSATQHGYWKRYQKEFPFARGISFDDAISSVRRLLGV